MKKRNWADKALGVVLVVMIAFLALIIVSARHFSSLGALKDWRYIGFYLSWLAIWIFYAASNRVQES